MLRSFDYAAYASLFASTPSRPAEFTRLEPWAAAVADMDDGRRSCAATSTSAATRCSFRPISPTRDALLRFFVLDKALYELNYEMNNRPDWIRIPLWGIFDLLQDA